MEKKYDICVVGGCSLDQTFFETNNGNYSSTPNIETFGGKGANQAVAAARAGAKVVMLSRVGKDEIGKSIINNLNQNGIDTRYVEQEIGLINDVSKVYVTKTGENNIFRQNGAIDSFTEEFIKKYEPVIKSSKLVIAQFKIAKEVSVALIHLCKKNNVPIVVTPCRPARLKITEPGNKSLIENISFITANQVECETIFETNDFESCVSQYPNKLFVTLGETGAIYHDGNKVVRIPAVHVPTVVDTTGAGDTFCGNMFAHYCTGAPILDCVKRATVASSIKIQSKSAQAGMPKKEKLDEAIGILVRK